MIGLIPLSSLIVQKCIPHCLWGETGKQKEHLNTSKCNVVLHKLYMQQHRLHITNENDLLRVILIHDLAVKAVYAQECDMFALTVPHILAPVRTLYSSPGSRWLTVHDLQRWMINGEKNWGGKKAHFIHRTAYLSRLHTDIPAERVARSTVGCMDVGGTGNDLISK